MAPSVGTHGRSFPISTSPEILKKLKRKGRLLAAEKAVTKETFQGEWTAPAPKFTAGHPEVTDWSEGAGALWARTAASY